MALGVNHIRVCLSYYLARSSGLVKRAHADGYVSGLGDYVEEVTAIGQEPGEAGAAFVGRRSGQCGATATS